MDNKLFVRMHSGSGHVKGKARNYPYFISSLFEIRYSERAKIHYFYNCGISTNPRRSKKLAEEDGKKLAKKHNANFIDGYGSLHLKRYFKTNV